MRVAGGGSWLEDVEAQEERVGDVSCGNADSFPKRLMCRTEKIF